MKNIAKILTALATIAGAVYIIATYGEQIVAWAKKILAAMPKCPLCKEEDDAEIEVEIEVEEPVAEEPPAAEEAAEEVAVEEPAPEVVIPAGEPVAEESDFAE